MPTENPFSKRNNLDLRFPRTDWRRDVVFSHRHRVSLLFSFRKGFVFVVYTGCDERVLLTFSSMTTYCIFFFFWHTVNNRVGLPAVRSPKQMSIVSPSHHSTRSPMLLATKRQTPARGRRADNAVPWCRQRYYC